MAADSPVLAVVTLAAFTALGIWAADRAEPIFGEKDSQKIVVDEIVGFMIANFAAAAGIASIAAAFILFRFFDIIKPYPARRAERLPGGAGVVLDDVVAGLYSLAVVRLALAWGIL
jgi:phosphatidylglycerophosphatase A